ncbi:MAG TPA: HIT family protein [Bacilli bacterium]|nr:HIT family protein [Bacilli bacterium]
MCVFCKIVAKEIPASILYEDESSIAFLDISQVTKGHTLIVPKNHVENLYNLSEQDATHLLLVASKLANVLRKTYQLEGLNMINNNGLLAGQTVNHFHIHLLPRYQVDELTIHFKQNEPNFVLLNQIKNEIQTNLK